MLNIQRPVHVFLPRQEGSFTYKGGKVTNRLNRVSAVARWVKIKFARKNNTVTDPRSQKCEPTLDQMALDQITLRIKMALPHTRKIEAARYVAAIIRGDA